MQRAASVRPGPQEALERQALQKGRMVHLVLPESYLRHPVWTDLHQSP